MPRLNSLGHWWSGLRIWDRILTVVAILAITITGTLIFLNNQPKISEGYSEFYILDLEKTTDDYPKVAFVGDDVGIIVGVDNHENQSMIYRVEINIDDKKSGQVEPFDLKNGDKIEQIVTFTPTKPGLHQEIDFVLFKGDSLENTLELHIWMDVEPSP